jgi:hypothetical protein
MQCCHLYTTCHVVRVANAAVVYQTKREIMNNDMV